MSIVCYLRGHKLKIVSNWRDITGGRGLWQCERCKLIHMDAPSEFYTNREKKTPSI